MSAQNTATIPFGQMSYSGMLQTINRAVVEVNSAHAAFKACLGQSIGNDADVLGNMAKAGQTLQDACRNAATAVTKFTNAVQMPEPEDDCEEVSEHFLDGLHEQLQALEIERAQAMYHGIPALGRLVAVADHPSGQCQIVRAFLLGLYNSYRFPFSLTRLRNLEKSLFEDCMAVLRLDARCTAREIDGYLEDFDMAGRFEQWAKEGV